MIKLKKVELSHFKNILNSGPVSIQPDVTCLVGKNESGKTDRASAAKLVEGKSKLLEGAADVHGAITKFLEAKVPLFFYFDEYSQLPGSVRIRHILETEKEKLSPAELAFETMLSSRDIDLIHRAMIGRFFWFEHVGRFDWYRSYQEHGLLPADPNRAEGGPLPPTVGVTLPDHRHFVCLRPIDTTGSTPTRGDEQFRMAFANTDLPKEIGLDYSHARTTSLVADIQAQNPAWEESDVFIEVAHRLGSFASFKSIDRHALRVWTKGAPPKNPASWPALIHTEPREVEVF